MIKDRGDLENTKRLKYLDKKTEKFIASKKSITGRIELVQKEMDKLKKRLNLLQDKLVQVDEGIKKTNEEKEYINSIVRFGNLEEYLDSDAPFEKKTQARFILKKHYRKLYEKIQDDVNSLETSNYFELQETKVIVVLGYILDYIFDFMCLKDMPNSIRNLKNLNIDNETFNNNLDTVNSIYYLTEQDYIKLKINVEFYKLLKKFNNPLNLLFYKNDKMLDIYVKNRGFSSKTFVLNYETYKLIKKKKNLD